MPTVQLDPQAEKDLAALMVSMSQDKDMRPLVNKFLKKTNGKVLPDVEIQEIREELKRERENEKLEDQRARALERQAQQKAGLKDRYDDASIVEIEKTMEKLGISDYDVGARIHAAETKPANPSYVENDHKWNLPNVDIKDFGNLKQNTRSKANQVIDEIIRNRKAS